MDLNADFFVRVAMHTEDIPWQASPMKGVDRRMLDRLGGEVARATTIVRYVPGSHFSPHVHTGGEEFIVLDGVFQDEHGDFPVGSYVRNPPTSKHKPGSEPGCTIFVKLWQFDMEDRIHVNINMNNTVAKASKDRVGVSTISLFHDVREHVHMEMWKPEVSNMIETQGGAEVLVLDGSFSESGEIFTKHSWLRVPDNYPLHLVAGKEGAKIWIKTGHLRHVARPSS
ncbi:cupin domain-containing protein [Kordiimonas aquimaris]|uniref:cupin domain-containing protein n=1 Tax=Kordiimonas aquimaris TaxID=707591 RepID=UPI0021D08B28|nr:cupin domain-containing protein [Kordiimonas aquimaris]